MSVALGIPCPQCSAELHADSNAVTGVAFDRCFRCGYEQPYRKHRIGDPDATRELLERATAPKATSLPATMGFTRDALVGLRLRRKRLLAAIAGELLDEDAEIDAALAELPPDPTFVDDGSTETVPRSPRIRSARVRGVSPLQLAILARLPLSEADAINCASLAEAVKAPSQSVSLILSRLWSERRGGLVRVRDGGSDHKPWWVWYRDPSVPLPAGVEAQPISRDQWVGRPRTKPAPAPAPEKGAAHFGPCGRLGRGVLARLVCDVVPVGREAALPAHRVLAALPTVVTAPKSAYNALRKAVDRREILCDRVHGEIVYWRAA